MFLIFSSLFQWCTGQKPFASRAQACEQIGFLRSYLQGTTSSVTRFPVRYFWDFASEITCNYIKMSFYKTMVLTITELSKNITTEFFKKAQFWFIVFKISTGMFYTGQILRFRLFTWQKYLAGQHPSTSSHITSCSNVFSLLLYFMQWFVRHFRTNANRFLSPNYRIYKGPDVMNRICPVFFCTRQGLLHIIQIETMFEQGRTVQVSHQETISIPFDSRAIHSAHMRSNFCYS